MDLTSGTVVVTGAASERGIGRAVARRMASEGRPLLLLDRDADGIAAAGAAIEAHATAPVRAIAADVTDPAAVDAALTAAERDLPAVTGLANIAGISDPTPFLDLDLERWERVLRVNLTGTFVVTHRVVRGMVERGLGRIVCLSSTAAQSGGGNYSTTAYAAAKSGIEGLVHGLARETAPAGVTVNCVSPAMIDTDIMGGPITPERAPAFVAAVPVGRLGTVDEVAAVIGFLLGPESGYITGATYTINGGARIG